VVIAAPHDRVPHGSTWVLKIDARGVRNASDEGGPEMMRPHLGQCADGQRAVTAHLGCQASGAPLDVEAYWRSYEHRVFSLPSFLQAVRNISAFEAAANARFVWRARMHPSVRGCDRSPDGTSTSPEADPPVVDVSDHGVTIIRPHRRSKR
jgi:hypothetical protein